MRHHIQKTVLDTLASAQSRRYSELKPPEIDGNTFGYHLKSLISDQYVHKTESGAYALTAKGKDFIVRRYEDPARAAHSIYLIVVKSGPLYLFRERKVQPLIGYIGFIHGEPEPGVGIIQSAEQRLRTKTGLTARLEVRGSALISQYLGDELQSFSHAVILYGETKELDIITEDATGSNTWAKPTLGEYVLPSCHDIIDMIDSGTTWLDATYYL